MAAEGKGRKNISFLLSNINCYDVVALASSARIFRGGKKKKKKKLEGPALPLFWAGDPNFRTAGKGGKKDGELSGFA